MDGRGKKQGAIIHTTLDDLYRKLLGDDDYADVTQTISKMTAGLDMSKSKSMKTTDAAKYAERLNAEFGTSFTRKDVVQSYSASSGGGTYRIKSVEELFGSRLEMMMHVISQKQEEERIKKINEALARQLAAQQKLDDEKRHAEQQEQQRQLEAEQQQRKQEQQAIEQRAYEADKSLYDKIKKIILEIMPTAQIPEMQQTPTPPPQPQQQQNNDRLNRDLQILLKSLSDAESHGDLQNIIGMHQKLETYYAKSGNNERYYYHKKQRHKLITELETQQQQDLYHKHGDQLFQLTQSLGIDQNSAEFDHYLKNNPHLFKTNQWVQTERGKTYQEFMKLYENTYLTIEEHVK